MSRKFPPGKKPTLLRSSSSALSQSGVVTRFGLSFFNNDDENTRLGIDDDIAPAVSAVGDKLVIQRLAQLDQIRNEFTQSANSVMMDTSNGPTDVAAAAAPRSTVKQLEAALGFNTFTTGLEARKDALWLVRERSVYELLFTSLGEILETPSASEGMKHLLAHCPWVRFQAEGGRILRLVQNWLMLHTLGVTMQSDEQLRHGSVLVRDVDAQLGIDRVFATLTRLLLKLAPATRITPEQRADAVRLVAIVLVCVFYPRALKSKWYAMARAITALLVQCAAVARIGEDVPDWLVALIPSLNVTTVEICGYIAERTRVLSEHHGACLGFLQALPMESSVIEQGPVAYPTLIAANPLRQQGWVIGDVPFLPAPDHSDPFGTSELMGHYMLSPVRAPLTFEIFARGGNDENRSILSPLITSFRIHMLSAETPAIVPYDGKQLVLSSTAETAARLQQQYPNGRPHRTLDAESLGEYEKRVRAAVPDAVRSPANLLLNDQVRQYLPLCACTTLKRGGSAGELHNEDRWWLTMFANDVIGHDTVDIEDLVTGFQTLCNRNFAHKQLVHVRGQHAHYERLIEKNRDANKPPFGLASCKAHRKPYFNASDRRKSCCPFVAANHTFLGGDDALVKLVRWQLPNVATPETTINKETLAPVLAAIRAGEPGDACLAHYNWLNTIRPSAINSAPRSNPVTYPHHFVHFQALRHADTNNH